ncbi:ribosomal protein S12 methylthiotransferase RimO [Bacteroidia bacterium]|nr:ribosomal protein S12 methylthiotransferase RimO [Bacteroidia bacterium]
MVDAELLLQQLQKAGYEVGYETGCETDGNVQNSVQACEQGHALGAATEEEVIIVNTCGFIGSAKEESVNVILEQVARKKAGIVKHLLVMGCLSQRYGADLQKELPEVDAFFGKFDWKGILAYLGAQYDENLANERLLTTPSHYAYLKISEGCNRTCSYCAIPIMTGSYKSRPMESLVEECKSLVARGVKEIILIAQDLTYYGTDIYGKNCIADLVSTLSDIKGVEWIRLHYAYPVDSAATSASTWVTGLLAVMRERANVCKYLDIALQHCSDRMLGLMRRGINKQQTVDLIRTLRQEVPGIFLRTTLMVGHPGETKEDFEELCAFVKEMKFERLGVFAYSHEEDTYCDRHYKDDVPQAVKKRRVEKIMKVQQELSDELSASLIGKAYKVLIDRQEGDYYVGRTEHDSPEIDTDVLVKTDVKLRLGEFCDVLIKDHEGFDLYGELCP